MAESGAMLPNFGREQTIEVPDGNGSTTKWKLSKWSTGIWDEWLSWAKKRLPNPLETALPMIEKLPPHLQQSLLIHAFDEANSFLSVGSPRVNALLQSPEGGIHLLWLMLRPNHDGVTEDQAADIALAYGMDRLQAKFDEAAGTVPARPTDAAAPAA